MAEPDPEAQLLDGIVGKYGEGSDYDLGNADEEALLGGYDEPDSPVIKRSSVYHDNTEELDHEPEEPDTEDVIDLEVRDPEFDDDTEERSNMNLINTSTVSSTTQPEMEVSLDNRRDLEERERGTDKFKNERLAPSAKLSNIPDSLEEVSVPINNRNGSRMVGQTRGRGRGNVNFSRNNFMQKNRPDNKTVLINPHFKGHVKINSEARLAWDARQKINHNKNQGGHQVGRVMPFTQNNRKQNQTTTMVHPWVNNNGPLAQNVPHYQPPAPVYQPPIFQQPPPQVSAWNQYQPNSFNQVPQQMGMNQNVFMQPIPQNVYSHHSAPQFNQPPPQYNPPPVFQNQMNSQPQIFTNSQFVPPNQFNPPPLDHGYHPGFALPNQPPAGYNQPNHQIMPPPPNPQFNQPVNNRFGGGNHLNNNNQYRNQQRFVRPKLNFNQGKMQFNQKTSPNKRKVDGNVDLRKKKRNLASTNLHEVPTVETPDTTVREEKPQEEEDEETRAYRQKIEEQKRIREELLKQKEMRRQQAIQKLKQAEIPATVVGNPGNATNIPTAHRTNYQNQPKQYQETPYRNLQVVRTNQTVRTLQKPESYPSTSRNLQQVVQSVALKPIFQQQQNTNIKIIHTSNDESNYDKQHLASFLTNRKILAKDQSLVDTSVVVISNLAAGTTDVKLRKMCQGIGEVKKLQMSPKERQATIQFNSVASAHAFFKKYQRTMLDLSMIQVTLKPMP